MNYHKSGSQKEDNLEVLDSVVDVISLGELRAFDDMAVEDLVHVGGVILNVLDVGNVVGLLVVSGVVLIRVQVHQSHLVEVHQLHRHWHGRTNSGTVSGGLGSASIYNETLMSNASTDMNDVISADRGRDGRETIVGVLCRDWLSS